tara:strand:- start:3978 stop:4223 length:246 start_codon:yes stop_codon:yes gene_type:complete
MSKISEQELKGLRDSVELQTKLMARLGDVEFQLNSLKQTKDSILETTNNIIRERNENLEKLKEKYGDGTLNIDTGEFNVTK